VAGLGVGHAQRVGGGWLSGSTVVLAPPGGAVAAVDVRGGGPGTRETDALDPRNLVEKVEAVLLTGGSAFGLDAAGGVMAWLEEQERGFRAGPSAAHVVPVVPTAALFDLGRGGDWRARPGAELGRAAVEAAAASSVQAPPQQGCVGAGTGARAGGMKGGVGTASVVLPSGVTVGALVAVNAVGSPIDPRTGLPYGVGFELAGEFCGLGTAPALPEETRARAEERLRAATEAARPTQAVRSAQAARPAQATGGAPETLNTTLAVVGTDAALTRAQAQKLAGTAHDGLARAIRPVHLLNDGDTVFALATGARALPSERPAEVAELNAIFAAGADAVARAVVHAMLCARTVTTPAGTIPSYRELYGVPGD